jgi:hypothetical protein
VVPATNEHAPPGRLDSLDNGCSAICPACERRAEAGEDQQRVVDPDADPEQRRDRLCPVRRIDDRGGCADQHRRDHEAEERRHERQACSNNRAERDEQDQRGRDECQQLRGRAFFLDRAATKLDA